MNGDRQPFPEPTFAPPGWQPPAGSFNATPHILIGGYWVSFDRQHWWNGAMWMPGPPPSQPGPTFRNNAPNGVGVVVAIVGLIAFLLFVVVGFGICTSMQQSGIPGAPMP